MRRRRGERTPMYAEVNVVSLIDLMMLLMVIFMITAPIMQGGVDLDLPKADARPVESKGGITISVTRDGKIYVDETAMSLSEFRASFRALVSRRANEGVYLRADRGSRVETFLQVLAILRTAGIPNVGIVTEPDDEGK
jgi:biopolymer transport protein ExbD/biopolymer transport protein TolR